MVTEEQIQQKINSLRNIRVPKVTRIMLQGGMQSRIRVKEIDRVKKERDKQIFDYKSEIENIKKLSKIDNIINSESNEIKEEFKFFKEPTLKKVRSYREWI